MKRTAVILLLIVHLFNIGGYIFISQYFIYRSDEQITKQVYDNKIDKARLIEIKVPVNLPGIADWKGYEKIDGQIQFKNAFYHYVRLKLTHDTMSMICIPNEVKTRLTNANIIIAKQFSDVPLNNKKSHETNSKKAEIDQDLAFSILPKIHIVPKIITNGNTNRLIAIYLSCPYIESPGKPPNVSC